ncbi:MAG: hypothetical protein WCJ58_01990 [bacterium]
MKIFLLVFLLWVAPLILILLLRKIYWLLFYTTFSINLSQNNQISLTRTYEELVIPAFVIPKGQYHLKILKNKQAVYSQTLSAFNSQKIQLPERFTADQYQILITEAPEMSIKIFFRKNHTYLLTIIFLLILIFFLTFISLKTLY